MTIFNFFKENTSSEQKASFAFRPTSVFGSSTGVNDSIATDTSSFVEESFAPATNTSSLGGSVFGALSQTSGAFSSSVGMKTTEKTKTNNLFAAKTSFPATRMEGKSEGSKDSSFRLKSSFGDNQGSGRVIIFS